MRFRRRSVSPASTSPVSKRAKPGFFAQKDSSTVSSAPQRSGACESYCLMAGTWPSTVSSRKELSPSNIWALLAK